MKPLFDEAKLATDAPQTTLTPSPAISPAILMPLDAVSANALAPVPASAVAPRPTGAVSVPAPRINDDQISKLGGQAVSSLSTISTELLKNVKTSDTGDFGKDLNSLVVLAKGLDPATLKDKGFLGKLFGAVSNAKERLVAQYSSVEGQIDALVVQLDAKAALHRRRVGDLETMYENNVSYHTVLEAAAEQGEQLLVQLQQDFVAAQEIAVHDSFGAQRLADHQRIIDRMGKRIDDLRRAMLLCKQMAPQIRMMQENARALVSKFGDLKEVSLPAFKNSFSLYVLQLEQEQGVKLAQSVDDMTDAALRRNADLLRQNVENIARARQRAVVTIETLEHVHNQLMGSVEDVKRIEAEGKAQRAAEQPKLLQMERDLIAAFAPKAGA